LDRVHRIAHLPKGIHMCTANLRVALLVTACLLLLDNPLHGDTPKELTSPRLNLQQASAQDIQQAINDLRESVNSINQRLRQLEELWQRSQEKSKHFEVWAMDSNGQNARRIAYAPGYHIINSPEVSPDGRFVAVDGWKAGESLTAARLLVIDIESGDVQDLGAGAMPNWSPDGDWIAYCKYSNEPGVFVRSLDGKTVRHIDPRGWGIQWSPDGWRVAYSKGNRFVVHNLITALSREIVSDEWDYTRIYWNPTWSPDSKEICFKATHKQGHSEFAIVSVGKRDATVRRRISAKGFNEDIAWHPDGTRILIPKAPVDGVRGQIYEFDPAKDDEPTPLAGQPKDRHNSGMCWSRDGKTLYFISHP
jgi:Tol biopolymer transport system component